MINRSHQIISYHSQNGVKTYSIISLATLIMMIMLSCQLNKETIPIYCEKQSSQLEFALEELTKVAESQDIQIKMSSSNAAKIRFAIDTACDVLQEEGFTIDVNEQEIRVTACDDAGLMYGGLELAEQIKIYGIEGVYPISKNPYMEMRGPKFNIPLDVRTPSYTDASDAGQKNIPVMWDYDFWTAFIDELARHRYNYISLWSLHPFPSLVKVPGYEDIALDDVQRSTGDWRELYNLNGIGMDSPEILENPEVVLKLSIEEKIDFWKKVMAYGKNRNIDFHIITWNIFDYGTAGKYGITDERTNPITQDYFRKSIKQLFITYPDLAGIGLTTGENIKGATPAEREDWAYETYAKGILEVAAEYPERNFTFIHRQHQTGAKEIAEKFKEVIEAPNIEFLYCFKYAKAHVYSATTQPYHEQDNFVADITGMKTIWGLRNDDTYYLRWGAPDFVREFILNLPHSVAKGIYFGSDQWIWGKDFLTKNPALSNQLEIKKQWYQWMLWGRLAYDPKISNNHFANLLGKKYPEIKGQDLLNAWQQASMIYPITTGFHWGRLDFQWYIEACFSHPKPAENPTGFHDVNRFITLPPHPKTGYESIPDFVNNLLQNEYTSLISPLEVSMLLHQHTNGAQTILDSLYPGTNLELEAILEDIQSMIYLGKYYAYKIAGSTYTALYRRTGKPEQQSKAIKELELALEQWEKYVENTLDQYHNPLWTNRVGIVDFKEISQYVKDDIELVRNLSI